MKAKSIVLGLLFTVIIVSCKKEPKAQEIKPKEEVVDKSFKVTLNLLIKKNDTIHLYYTEDNTIKFTEESSIWTSVLGKDQPQDVVFKLTESAYPTQFRIDLGVNKENEKIKLNGVKFNYLDKSFAVNDIAIYKYFRVNTDNSILDSKTNELSRKDPNISSGASLYPLEIPLKTEIDKLAR